MAIIAGQVYAGHAAFPDGSLDGVAAFKCSVETRDRIGHASEDAPPTTSQPGVGDLVRSRALMHHRREPTCSKRRIGDGHGVVLRSGEKATGGAPFDGDR